jgi:hypothetical protein
LNPHFVTCLLISALSGVVAAGLVATSGWGWPFALLAYSVTGSASLLLAAMVALPGAPRTEREPPAVAERQRAVAI